MMEKTNDTFFPSVDALMYLVGPVHKKHSTTFVLGHPSSTYVSYDRFFKPLPLVCIFTHLDKPSICVSDFIDLVLSSPPLTFFGCDYFLYCFASEIQQLMFLSQTLTTSWHLIQFTVAYLKRLFINGGFRLSVVLLFMIADQA